jgi:hypothetical protein
MRWGVCCCSSQVQNPCVEAFLTYKLGKLLLMALVVFFAVFFYGLLTGRDLREEGEPSDTPGGEGEQASPPGR